MTQMRRHDFDFILSDIVCEEIRKMRLEKVQQTTKSFRALESKLTQTPLDTASIKSHLKQISDEMLSSEEYVEAELEKWIADTGCEVISSSLANTEQVLDKYFTGKPPFNGSKNKKNEFPDAFALISIEAWAQKYETRVLAISQDNDWISYGETSERLDVIPSLLPVFEQLNKVRRDIVVEASEVIQAIIDEPEGEFGSAVHEHIRWIVEETPAHYEVSTDGYFEMDDEMIELVSLSVEPLESDSSLVNIDGDYRVVEVTVNIKVRASATITHLHYDKPERSYHELNSDSANITKEEQLTALVHYGNIPSYADKGRVIEIDSVELLNFNPAYNFGYIDVF